ncbi:uncharacterized protein LOC133627194 isoform X2 [Colius striatus]|uniref:uncharacterized protein LOC133627194 isoform X2 n=1 Tax=Colius striatus TaxID=57412 RepID=UPI002B1D87C2|nr:uncharacterized protein LOC133627194 isoform X2 [Colius striatus]
MESFHFICLCFLLLTVAAPCSIIAMSSDNHTEETLDSSSGNTAVTVYHCKDCESEICESSDYAGFAKIAETKHRKFSNEVIQLETNETHIVMCFLQENTVPGGVYAIFWQKDTGLGDSCGIPDPGASSQRWEGDSTIGKIKVCCKAETNILVPNRTLMCYTEMLDEKTSRSTAEIPDNPQHLVNQKSSIGIVTTLLILGLCVALAVYCVRQKRNGQGRVLVLQQVFNEQKIVQ